MGIAKFAKGEGKAVVREKQLIREPMEEGIARIGISESGGGANYAYMEIREGRKGPGVTFGRGELCVNGTFLQAAGQGKKVDGQGRKSAIIKMLDPEKSLEGHDIDLLPSEEALVSIGGSKCRLEIASRSRESGPDDDTDPLFRIPEGMMRGEGGPDGLMRFDSLSRGETLEITEGYALRYVNGGPCNRSLEILNPEGGRDKEFVGEDGAKFELNLGGVKEALVLKVVKGIRAEERVDVFIYSKSWERNE